MKPDPGGGLHHRSVPRFFLSAEGTLTPSHSDCPPSLVWPKPTRRTLWRRTMRHSCVSDNRLAICDSHTPAYKRAAAQLNLPTTHSPHLSPAHTQLHSPSTTSLLWSSMDLQTVPTWPPPATPLTSSSRIRRQAPDAACPAPVLQQDNTRAETPITGIDTAQLRGRRRRSRGSPPPPPPPRSARTSRNTPTTSSRHRARPQEAQHEAQRGGGGGWSERAAMAACAAPAVRTLLLCPRSSVGVRLTRLVGARARYLLDACVRRLDAAYIKMFLPTSGAQPRRRHKQRPRASRAGAVRRALCHETVSRYVGSKHPSAPR